MVGREFLGTERDFLVGPLDGEFISQPREDFIAGGVAEQNDVVIGEIRVRHLRIFLHACFTAELFSPMLNRMFAFRLCPCAVLVKKDGVLEGHVGRGFSGSRVLRF